MHRVTAEGGRATSTLLDVDCRVRRRSGAIPLLKRLRGITAVSGAQAFSGFVMGVEEPTGRYAECISDVEQPLIEQSSSTMFDGDQHIASDARLQGKSLLRQPAGNAQPADIIAHSTTVRRPCRDPLRIILAGSRRHATQ